MSASIDDTANDREVHSGVTQLRCRASRSGRSEPGRDARWLPPFADVEFPPVPLPSRKVFAVAGEGWLRMLVRRHYERLVESSLGRLFPSDPQEFARGVERTTDFVIEAVGGPCRYSASARAPCMRTMHFAFTIDERAREIWLAELLQAFDDVGFPEEVRFEVWNWLEAMSIRMINRRTTRLQPIRYPLADARAALSPFMRTRRPPVMCPR